MALVSDFEPSALNLGAKAGPTASERAHERTNEQTDEQTDTDSHRQTDEVWRVRVGVGLVDGG